ncbi:putative zinc-binding protein [Anaeroselena agilis]|uniref:Glycine cleavage system H protein n=1 Tax=Anaeroselena agilis TaxID=3063788 RepID=A0ABU3NWX1_9FIRM|nr:putative zinc-binding protein [Selenomonadales bacterium 4137-cl]
MTKKYAVLPCNGLDKCAGQMAREIALTVCEKTDSQLICPVFYRVADARYNKIANENPLLVIDGCATRCASKLAAEKNLKIYRKMTVTDETQKHGVTLAIEPLRLWEDEINLCAALAAELIKEEDVAESMAAAVIYPVPGDYLIHTKDKFMFRIPPEGFYFTENDCWVQPVGNRARIGVADYVQQSLSDIMFFTPPPVGVEVEQFGEAGAIESGKAVFELVCPVSGKIVAINKELLNSPEKINENPYEQGWIAELELTNFDEEKDFLLDADGYLQVLKRKVDEFHVNQRKG